MFQGVHLTGGGALLRGMTQRLADATAVPVHLVDTPLECVVQGAGICLESFDKLPAGSSPRTTNPDRHPRAPVAAAPPERARRATRRRPGGPASRGRRRPGGGRAPPPVVEAGQRHGGAAPHRRLVLERAEDGREAGRVADGAQRGDGRFAAAGVAVPSPPGPGRPRRGGSGARRGTRPRPPPPAGQGRPARRRAAGKAERDPLPATVAAASTARRRTADRARPGPARPRPPSSRPMRGQCAQRGHPDRRIGVASPRPGRASSPVAGRDDAAPPQPGALVARPIRGKIVAHRPRVCLTLTRAPTRRRPRPPPTTRIASATPGPAWPRRRAAALGVAGGRDRARRPRPAPGGRLIANRCQFNHYVITPGDASPVSQYIEVPAAVQPPAHRQDPADRRLRHPAERPLVPVLPLRRLQQRDRPGRPISSVPTPNQTQLVQQGYLADGPGPDVRHGRRAHPPRVPGGSHQRRRSGLRHRRRVARLRDVAGGPGDRPAVDGTSTPTVCALV